MNEKLDVFEILGQKNTELKEKGQNQATVSDPDFNDAIKMLDQRYSNVPQKKAPVPAAPAVSKKAEPKHPTVPAAPKKRKRILQHTEGKNKNRKKEILKMMLLLAVLMIFFTFVINISSVSGSSMAPLLENGDKVVINRLARNFEKGDVIVFEAQNGSKLVKRVVAVDGDVVNILPEKGFYINGTEVTEEYIYTETGTTDIRVSYPIIVGEDEYFVLGDNRTNSKDSRNADVGMVKAGDITGKVIFSIRSFK